MIAHAYKPEVLLQELIEPQGYMTISPSVHGDSHHVRGQEKLYTTRNHNFNTEYKYTTVLVPC